MALGSTQPLVKMSIRNISWGVKAVGARGWRPHHLHVPNIMKIWESKSPGTLWAAPGLLRDTFTLHISARHVFIYNRPKIFFNFSVSKYVIYRAYTGLYRVCICSTYLSFRLVIQYTGTVFIDQRGRVGSTLLRIPKSRLQISARQQVLLLLWLSSVPPDKFLVITLN
jgi:hypothetical protein